MHRFFIVSILVVSALFLNSQAAEIWVDISNYEYGPGHLFVEEGTVVTWTNYDAVQHTVTSDANLFNSGLISQAQTWSYTFSVAGDYPYHCIPHPFMVGEVHVRTAANLDLLLDLAPVGGPIVIPSNGGSFQYVATGTNQTANLINFDYWVKAYLPNNSPFLAYGPVNFGLIGGRTATKTLSQNVPGSAPAGTYRYVAYMGTVGATPSEDVVKAWSSFEFTKSPADGLDLGGWESVVVSPWTLSEAGNALETGSAAKSEGLKLWNSPEPFNPSTTINFSLPADGIAHLDVFNVQGARVASLADGYMSAGQYQVAFDASNLTSGMYLYRLNFEGQTVSGKMLLVK